MHTFRLCNNGSDNFGKSFDTSSFTFKYDFKHGFWFGCFVEKKDVNLFLAFQNMTGFCKMKEKIFHQYLVC